ncbi:hypothetical protein L5515_018908 [Caenorhabditis briggsae]|uniref:Uncharacterized protein n=2 Tax=Caenorhabditis briggsae TaxID=6238 RepID=A0AAE9FKG1_CAEBR|nr:hypothetical protein L5515_018908 [Caenorhabditis briggsae]
MIQMDSWLVFAIIAVIFVGDVVGDKYSCTSGNSFLNYYVHRPLETFQRSDPIFNSPCSCAQDWNTMFCNQTLTALHENINPLPTVCICRKFNDNRAKCQQFITRCFSRKNNECSCCFNQPKEWCNQLKCKNREPDFSNPDTTCVCHHNPADYPYDICKNLFPRDSDFANRQAILDKNRERSQGTVEYVELLGKRVSTSVVSYIIVGLLLSVSVLTLVMLVLGGKRLRQKRAERQRQIRLARETLILQRADDDRYLPSA